VIGGEIQAVEGIQEIDFDCFSKQLINLLNFGDKYLFNALDEKYDEVSKILTEGKLEEGKKLLSIISIASMLYLEESKKNLLKCYKK
jgi:hypothetical protein